MPVRVCAQLEPVHARALPPPHTGPAVYAALLRAIGEQSAALATRMHDWRSPKPFTLTPVLDEWDQPVTTAGAPARVEIGLLLDELTAPVLAALHELDHLRIANTTYHLTRVEVPAGASYADLAGRARPRTRWQFTLLSPIGFATAQDEGARRYRPWPDAVRVLRNLAERWNAFAGAALPDGTTNVIEEHAETVDGDCRVVEHLVKPGGEHHREIYARGCVGTITYALAPPPVPAAYRRAVDALAEFAGFAGFGDRTSVGMGYVRPVPFSDAPPPRAHHPHH